MQTSVKPLLLKQALDRLSPNYQILDLKKAGVDFYQFLVLSAISHSSFKLLRFKVQRLTEKVGGQGHPSHPASDGHVIDLEITIMFDIIVTQLSISWGNT